ncbi:MAG: UDP-N-acetylmuramoyl-L-alanine--D-glutamate ligase [Saprospiraceae bacterium]
MNLIVLGAGESGVGAAILGKKEGWQVFVSDFGNIKDAFKAELQAHQIEFEEGKHSLERIEKADLVIKSPGIPDKVAIIQQLKSLNIEIIDEIEFGFRYAKSATIIAITGSNGKTTVTGLTHHVLKTAGLNARLGGNIGISFAKQVAELDNLESVVFILEVSSFQLDYCSTFRPDISILINITPDHLDRYDYKFENYVASKFRITQSQTATDIFIFNEKDEAINAVLKKPSLEINAKKIGISNIYNKKGALEVGQNIFDTNKMSLKGPHNHFNAACAIRVSQLLGLPKEAIEEGLATFINAPHRLELITNINGIDFINDSKATNIDSAFQALRAMSQPTIWIAGGTDKGNDYNVLVDLVKEKVTALICLCEDSSKLLAAFEGIIPIIKETKDIKEAVKMAYELANKGNTVLLSPACASFDLFDNYVARGDLFREAVYNYQLIINN